MAVISMSTMYITANVGPLNRIQDGSFLLSASWCCQMCVLCFPRASWPDVRAAVPPADNRRMDEWVKQENLDLNTVDVGDVDGDPK